MTPGSFSGFLSIAHTARREWRVLEDFSYCTRAGRIHTIPEGFVINGTSSPRIVWWLYPPMGGRYDEASAVHDYLYATAEQHTGTDHGHLSRGEADTVLKEGMEVKQLRGSAVQTIYRMIRMWGWKAWRSHRKRVRREATNRAASRLGV